MEKGIPKFSPKNLKNWLHRMMVDVESHRHLI